ncbi:MAG: S26 family signal peptidase [Promethearchaeota archaeon]
MRKKIIHIIQLVSLSLIIGFFIFFYLNFNRILIITSYSMEPTIKIGDMVLYQEVNASDIYADTNSGDIIVIKGPEYFYQHGVSPMLWGVKNGTPIVHRAINKIYNFSDGKWYFETKGDYNQFSDGCIRGNFRDGYGIFVVNYSNPIFIPETEILGKVTIIIPFVGNIGLYFNKITVIVVILVIFIIIIDKLDISIKFERKKNKIKN